MKNVQVRKVMALTAIGVIATVALLGAITGKELNTSTMYCIGIFSNIISYYIGKSTALDVPGGAKADGN